MNDKISGNKIRQIFFLSIILILVGIIVFNLKSFLPALLGAMTLYILLRNYQFRFTEIKKWKSWVSALFLMFISILIIVIPVYFLIDSLVSKLANSGEYVEAMINQAEQIHKYIENKTGYNVLDSLDLKKIGEWATRYSSSLINTTIDMFTTLGSAYFMLYFMLVNGRTIERAINAFVPLKKSNIDKIEDRFNKLVMANVIGIPVVALGQGLTLLIGYLIAGADSPLFLFALTCVASVIPIVGGAIVYIPVTLMMLVNGNVFGAVIIVIFGVLSSVVDNIFRFTFLKKLEDIHPLNSVFGIILGLNVFGFIGLVFGPILISITLLLIQVYHDEFSDDEPSLPDEMLKLSQNNTESEQDQKSDKN